MQVPLKWKSQMTIMMTMMRNPKRSDSSLMMLMLLLLMIPLTQWTMMKMMLERLKMRMRQRRKRNVEDLCLASIPPSPLLTQNQHFASEKDQSSFENLSSHRHKSALPLQRIFSHLHSRVEFLMSDWNPQGWDSLQSMFPWWICSLQD